MSTQAQLRRLKELSEATPEIALQTLLEMSQEADERLRRPIGQTINSLQLPTPKIRLLGSCTLDYLAPLLAADLFAAGIPFQVGVGGFDQALQDLGSQTDPYAVLVPWRNKLVDPEAELFYWQTCWKQAQKQNIRIDQLSYDWIRAENLGSQAGQCELITELNNNLRQELPQGHFFLELGRIAGRHGRKHFYDNRNLFWTKQPFSDQGLEALSSALVPSIRALVSGPKKVIVVDLDNTLWGGEVGELGPENIELEGAEGDAFLAFQSHLKHLSERGVLLAISSKNEEAIALEAIAENPYMILRPEDFVATQIHWEPKSQSLLRIAKQLKLGLDSFVFFDDNPRERSEVKLALPEVAVVPTTGDPFQYLDDLVEGRYFETLEITEEDRGRTHQYRAETQRTEAKESVEDYLTFLQMKATVSPISDQNLARMVQLFARTNQFNLTTRRHGREALLKFAELEGSFARSLALSDRFGDLGIVSGLVAIPVDPTCLRIDSWIMSCRAMQRTVEFFFFEKLVEHAKALGYQRILAEYLPTKKNLPVKELLPSLGFKGQNDGLELRLENYQPIGHHID